MIVEYEGRQYHFDPQAITVDEWRELKRKYKMTPKQFEDGLAEADPDAVTFAYWIMLRRNGRQNVPLGDHLKPDILALNDALNAAQLAELQAQPPEEEGEEAGPTRPSPSPPPSPPSPEAPRSRRGEGVDASRTGS